MTIDWTHFTPWSALVGGALIGIAAALFVLFNGRIAGISGVIGGLISSLLQRRPGDTAWRLAFVAGILLAPWVFQVAVPLPAIDVSAGTGTLIVSGLAVGIGTRYGSGCTSGHGVCGLSRLSLRSAVATVCFMAAGFATVAIVRHVLG